MQEKGLVLATINDKWLNRLCECNGLVDECPVEAEAYHKVLSSIAGGYYGAIAKQLLQLIGHQVGTEAFYPEVEEEACLRCVRYRVGVLIIKAVEEGAVACRCVTAMVAHFHTRSYPQCFFEYRGFQAQLMPA